MCPLAARKFLAFLHIFGRKAFRERVARRMGGFYLSGPMTFDSDLYAVN